jgi:hypothetical protein
MLSNVINPYIYGLFDRDLRKMLRKLCKRWREYTKNFRFVILSWTLI